MAVGGNIGAGFGVLVGCGVDVGDTCPMEQDKRKRAIVITNKKVLEFSIRVLISSLLADGILQYAQSFDFHDHFISIL